MTNQADNIMLDVAGQPVNVPGMPAQNVVQNADGTPVVPTGVEPALNQAPKDTLPRPAPQQVPVQQVPVQTQVTTQPNAAEGAITFEELAAKKGFKSPDDLAKSYANLESQNKRVEVTLADAINARMESTETVQPVQPVQPVQTVQPSVGVEDESAALGIVDARIKKQLRTQEDTLDYKLHLIQNPSDQQFAAEAIKVVKDNPGIKWGIAFDAAKSRMSNVVTQQAREEGANEAYANIEQKQDAQVITGPQQRPASFAVTSKDVIDGVKTGKITLAETRNIINSLSNDLK